MSHAARLDPDTSTLVRLAAAIAAGVEPALHEAMTQARRGGLRPEWVDELLLQSILMAGYPRALLAFGLWRALSGVPAPPADDDASYARVSVWEARGAATCERIYGSNYARLRDNVRALHPAVDTWMLVEGYGRTLSRPGLDLKRRELCTVAQTAVLQTPRQLRSHLSGALNSGATVAEVEAALECARASMTPAGWDDAHEVWATVRGGRTAEG
jgi:4-carboxymuconolactone decarboxylase